MSIGVKDKIDININSYKFDDSVPEKLAAFKYGKNWPIVYIINNAKEVYIGETLDATKRASQHLKNKERRRLNLLSIIGSSKFNKSVILDIEAFLIKYMAADRKFELQNGNGGLQNHNYFQRELYKKRFPDIWNKLLEKGLVENSIEDIENSDLFKFSPYQSLTDDQYKVVGDILNVLVQDIENNRESTFIINGGSGTGKTVVAMYLIKLLSELQSEDMEFNNDMFTDNVKDLIEIKDLLKDMKIGIVVSMENLRVTLKEVFKGIKGLKPSMVLNPNDVANSDEMFDILIIDEAHRLRRKKNLSNYNEFNKKNAKFGLGDEGTELDWIKLRSRYQIFLYDDNQTVRPTDIRKEKMLELKTEVKQNENDRKMKYIYNLQAQLRCFLGGNEYIEYVKSIFSNTPPNKKIEFGKYDFKLFDDVNEMVNEIKLKNEKYDLCRNVAGFSWEWKTKEYNKLSLKELKDRNLYDIEIDGNKYIWNRKPTNWISSPDSVEEIGSIHTVQGFDLNYTGIIIGRELKYDDVNNRFYIDRDEYLDKYGKRSADDEELLEYILNIYYVFATRGVRGTYIFAENPKVRKYLERYINKYNREESLKIEKILDNFNNDEEFLVAEENENYQYNKN